MKLPLYERVALCIDFPDSGLKKGDVVTTVEFLKARRDLPNAYVVEAFNAVGETIAVFTVAESDLATLTAHDVLSRRTVDYTYETTVERVSVNQQWGGDSIVVMDEHPDETSATPSVQPDTITIELPDTLLAGQNLTRGDIQLQLAIFLFQQEWYSLGKASEFARLHPAQFQKELANRHIPLHYDSDDYKADINVLNAGTISSVMYHPAS